MKEEDTKNIEVSEKHIGLRLVLFIVFLLVAVFSFSYGVTSIGKKEAGYQTIDALQDTSVPLYGNELSFSYYCEGTSNSIKKEVKTLSKVYSQILSNAYKMLDSVLEYSGSVSIGAINNNLGQSVSISPVLYEVLKDAYSRTLERKNFNMFAGALYAEWKSILILDDASSFDPLNSPYMAQRIEEISQEVSNLDNFNLEFLDDEKCIVRFSVSDHYSSFCKDMEIEAGALDLNVLYSAYLLELVAHDLLELGYNNGILVSGEGLCIVLNGGEESTKRVDSEVSSVDDVSSTAFISAFQNGGYYNAIVNGHYRHLFINTTTGSIEDVILSCSISSNGFNLVNDMATLVYLASLSSKEQVVEELSYLRASNLTVLSIDCDFQDGTSFRNCVKII